MHFGLWAKVLTMTLACSRTSKSDALYPNLTKDINELQAMLCAGNIGWITIFLYFFFNF